MFGKRQVAAPAAAPAILLTQPLPRAVVAGTHALGAYEQLAKELNYMPAQLLQEQVLRFLGEHNIQIYDYGEVDQYMGSLAEERKKVWVWRPLREQDKPTWQWEGRPPNYEPNRTYRGHGSYRNEWDYRPYPHAVPIHVLRNVKKIGDQFGERVKFLVSDYADPKPDPFIMVTALDMDMIVFDVWDEPGFGTE